MLTKKMKLNILLILLTSEKVSIFKWHALHVNFVKGMYDSNPFNLSSVMWKILSFLENGKLISNNFTSLLLQEKS